LRCEATAMRGCIMLKLDTKGELEPRRRAHNVNIQRKEILLVLLDFGRRPEERCSVSLAA
jgi:hypothetical protein